MYPNNPYNKSNKAGRSIAIGSILLVLITTFFVGVLVGQNDLLTSHNTSEISENSQLPQDLDYQSVEEIYDIVRKNYDGELSQASFMDELKQAIARATGDPYTEYFNATDAEVFNQELEGKFTGIGAELGKRDGNLIIVAPLAGYPAEAAGLKPLDVIAKIDDEDATGLTVYEAVTKIRGEVDTDVKLTIVRNGKEVIDFTITRMQIDAPSVSYEIQDNIGVIKLSQFQADSDELLDKAAEELLKAGVEGIILDLRGNPGGYLDQAQKILGDWLDSSQVAVEVRRGGKVEEKLYATGDSVFANIPTVVLINEGSASASEIVAGALQDYGVAKLVGKQTFGKGSVQNIDQLDNGQLLKITTGHWFTPNGRGIDKEGIAPDVEVELTDKDYDAGRDPQLDKALELIKQ
ncbi:S41 family peptidase [Candidatus Saccharibacteria bacterium]|nr:S41 family peptidase [Candidatus Saccharibacteria bacterium]MCB9821359.1 S41 family peptidase [Candidatus Nomurabacteria bacterium]